jgi:phosphoribosylformylglycinamidine (FGAM) synthase PurS component
MTQCVSDEQAKAIAKSVLDLQFSGVEILRGEQVIYHELKSSKPN